MMLPNSKIKLLSLAAVSLGLTQSGCMVAGYTISGGWFLWPGGLGLLVLLVIFMMMRRGS